MEDNIAYNQRVIEAAEELVAKGKVRSLASLAKQFGKTSQYFTALKKGKSKYPLELLDFLTSNYPVNKQFVLSGIGDILINETTNSKITTQDLNI